MMDRYKDNAIVNMTLSYALTILDFSEVLREQKRYVVADQVLRSGCGIGANVREAQNAESKADFVHKMKIAAKEADENEFWLTLCKRSKSYPFDDKLEEQLTGIIKVLNKIIGTSKRRKLSNSQINELPN
jgi:four helix bundle protein